jgi:hypothetical protein
MKPLNLDNSPWNPISSHCVIWQGPDLACIKLCKGDTVSDVLAILNFKEAHSAEYTIKLAFANGIPVEVFYPDRTYDNILTKSHFEPRLGALPSEDEDDDNYAYVEFSPANLISYDASQGRAIFKTVDTVNGKSVEYTVHMEVKNPMAGFSLANLVKGAY